MRAKLSSFNAMVLSAALPFAVLACCGCLYAAPAASLAAPAAVAAEKANAMSCHHPKEESSKPGPAQENAKDYCGGCEIQQAETASSVKGARTDLSTQTLFSPEASRSLNFLSQDAVSALSARTGPPPSHRIPLPGSGSDLPGYLAVKHLLI